MQNKQRYTSEPSLILEQSEENQISQSQEFSSPTQNNNENEDHEEIINSLSTLSPSKPIIK